MKDSKSKGKTELVTSVVCSCNRCHKRFKYENLIMQPSWNKAWTDYLSPCCKASWSSIRDNVYDSTKYRNKY